MNFKSIIATLAVLVGSITAHAQEIVTGTVDTSHADLPGTTMTPSNVSTAPKTMTEQQSQNVWKRKKYFYLSYGIQKQKDLSTTINSDMAFALIKGRTYYLHKKAIARILKFGIDWNQLDLNYAKFPDLPSSSNTDDETIGLPDLGSMQIEAGMGVGPSITVNPVNHLKVALYFHVTPSYSLILQNSELYHHYATFFNVGLTASYKVISIGIENRWSGKTDYGGVSMTRANELYDEQGNFIDPFLSVGSKISNHTFRIFVGFRF